MADKPQGFWSSIPGILTGIAAVITAFTGLYLAIDNSKKPTTQLENANIEITTPSPTRIEEQVVEQEASPTPILQPTSGPNPTVAVDPTKKVVQQPQGKLPFPETGPLVDCTLFPTINTVTSLMSWSNYYHKKIIAAGGVKRRATDPCNQAIDQRGMAHCKAPDDLEIRQALHETLTLCRAAGIEWQDIQHSTILGKE